MNEDIKSDSEMKLLDVLESLCSSFLSLKAMITNAFKRTIVGEARDTKPITIQRAIVSLTSPAVTYVAYNSQQKNSGASMEEF